MPLILIDSVDSTMNEIKKSKYDFYSAVAILAKKQTEGRGRRNNKWISEPGNLFLAIRLKNRTLINHHLLSYMVSIIVFDALKNYLNKNKKMFIKWPNDIHINNKKACGILIEFLSSGNTITDIIIGIGINIQSNPKNINKLVTNLAMHCKKKIKILDLTKLVLSSLDYWINMLVINKESIIDEWMKRSKHINSKIQFNFKNKLVVGLYKGISTDGAIKVLVEGKTNKFFNLEFI